MRVQIYYKYRRYNYFSNRSFRIVFAKIVQMSEKASSLLECFSECSLSLIYKPIISIKWYENHTKSTFFAFSYKKLLQKFGRIRKR